MNTASQRNRFCAKRRTEWTKGRSVGQKWVSPCPLCVYAVAALIYGRFRPFFRKSRFLTAAFASLQLKGGMAAPEMVQEQTIGSVVGHNPSLLTIQADPKRVQICCAPLHTDPPVVSSGLCFDRSIITMTERTKNFRKKL